MIIPTHFGAAVPLWRPQALLKIVDIRPALTAVANRSLVPASDALVRHVMGRAWRGARFAEDITAAATMVAAARH